MVLLCRQMLLTHKKGNGKSSRLDKSPPRMERSAPWLISSESCSEKQAGKSAGAQLTSQQEGCPPPPGSKSCPWRRGCSEEAPLEDKNTWSPVHVEGTRNNVTFPWLTLYHPVSKEIMTICYFTQKYTTELFVRPSSCHSPWSRWP